MKHIIAIIRPEKLDDVRHALEKAGCSGLMISEISGHGKQKGVVQQWRGEKYKVDLIPKIKLEVMIKDSELGIIKKTIMKTYQEVPWFLSQEIDIHFVLPGHMLFVAILFLLLYLLL